ncbi:hypothetical protein HOK021_53590 [Streptomyces hygroscopicus]|nr:hypothetical protein HOK021_53590 [Streptomyces hygroscopicus]
MRGDFGVKGAAEIRGPPCRRAARQGDIRRIPAHVGEVSTRERLPSNPAFDLAPAAGSGLYLSRPTGRTTTAVDPGGRRERMTAPHFSSAPGAHPVQLSFI